MVKLKSEIFGGEEKTPKMPNFSSVGSIILVATIVIAALWFVVSGPFYTVGPDQEGVVLRFGKYVRSTSPGFHFKWPGPIETVETPEVTQIKRLEVGFETIDPGPPARYRQKLEESLMLTGDENLVQVELIVQYQIIDAVQYLFTVKDQKGTLKDILESVVRQVIGDYGIDSPLTTGKDAIQIEIQEKTQEVANLYGLGVRIVAVQLQDVQPPKEVAQAFKDVASARENMNKYINEAKGYKYGEIAKSQGEAEKLLREAEAYKQERIALAQGEVEKFSEVLKKYQNAKEITKTRIYLETMEKVLAGKQKTIIDSESEGVLKLLDISPKSMKGGERQ